MSQTNPVDYIQRTKEQYERLGYDDYRWAEKKESPPWTPIGKPISESNIALVASGGAYTEGQIAFHWEDDTGIRLIPSTEPASDVRVTHFAYDLEPAREDPNIVFPTDRLNELVTEKTIGSLATNSIACMGGIYSARRAEEELAPLILESISNMPGEPVDLVLLVPV